MNFLIKYLRQEDWAIVAVGFLIVAFSVISCDWFPVLQPHDEMIKGLGAVISTFLVIMVFALLINRFMEHKARGFGRGFFVVFILSVLSSMLSQNSVAIGFGIEPVFFAIVIGLLVSNVIGVPVWLRSAIRTEFYIKTGVICLGASVMFKDMAALGVLGILQAVIVVFVVWTSAYWISHRFHLDDETSMMLSSGISICGVSAAITTSSTINGDSKKLSYVISLILVGAIPMIYFMPFLCQIVGLDKYVSGALIGGTIDTTGAVAASGNILGTQTAEIAVIVKASQNVLLGIVAFIISLLWTYKGTSVPQYGVTPRLRVVWHRFPKFVLGFIIVSLLFSFVLPHDMSVKSSSVVISDFCMALFSMAFVSIGLETRVKDVFSAENRRTLYAYLVSQSINIVVTFIVASAVFGILRQFVV